MPDPIIEPKPNIDDAAELATLRRVNAELLQAKHTLKARIATLEGEAANLDSKAEKAVSTMRAAVIELPLKRLAAEVSNAPELFLAELQKDFDVRACDDGNLGLIGKDGKPALNHEGKPVEFSHVGLYRLLAGLPHEPSNERRSTYRTLMKYKGASGGIGRKVLSSSEAPGKDAVASSFGLR